jgi:hypothetical protein
MLKFRKKTKKTMVKVDDSRLLKTELIIKVMKMTRKVSNLLINLILERQNSLLILYLAILLLQITTLILMMIFLVSMIMKEISILQLQLGDP